MLKAQESRFKNITEKEIYIISGPLSALSCAQKQQGFHCTTAHCPSLNKDV